MLREASVVKNGMYIYNVIALKVLYKVKFYLHNKTLKAKKIINTILHFILWYTHPIKGFFWPLK